MSLDPTARRANIKDTVKRFVHTVYSGEITFDKSMSSPDLMNDKTVDRWINIDIGEVERGYLSTVPVEIRCASRKDPEGFKLAQLTDTVMDFLSDTTMSDGMKRIPFYRSVPSGPDSWVLLGAFVVQEVFESKEMYAPDNTKYITLTAILKTASKI